MRSVRAGRNISIALSVSGSAVIFTCHAVRESVRPAVDAQKARSDRRESAYPKNNAHVTITEKVTTHTSRSRKTATSGKINICSLPLLKRLHERNVFNASGILACL